MLGGKGGSGGPNSCPSLNPHPDFFGKRWTRGSSLEPLGLGAPRPRSRGRSCSSSCRTGGELGGPRRAPISLGLGRRGTNFAGDLSPIDGPPSALGPTGVRLRNRPPFSSLSCHPPPLPSPSFGPPPQRVQRVLRNTAPPGGLKKKLHVTGYTSQCDNRCGTVTIAPPLVLCRTPSYSVVLCRTSDF